MKMKKSNLSYVCTKTFLVILFALWDLNSALAQPNGTVFITGQNVISEDNVDVSWQIVRCFTSNQVNLSIQNLNAYDQQVSFQISVTESVTGKSFIKKYNLELSSGQILSGDCADVNNPDELKIELPQEFDPGMTSIVINFE